MQSVKNLVGQFSNEDLKVNFFNAMKDEKFKKLRNLIKLNDDKLLKYTFLLKDASVEYDNCCNCKGLNYCKNEMKGYVYFPHVEDEKLVFSYDCCKYKRDELEDTKYYKNVNLFKVPDALKNAKVKDIYVDDASRIEVVKYIDNYLEQYNKGIKEKGLYLNGNFGSGKTYMISALFNELAKKGVKSYIVYFPELLRSLKSSFSSNEYEEIGFEDKFEIIKKIPFLLIDDIGAENVTPWSRDEILGTLLQYRMDAKLPTFFTSNLTIDELEAHLSITNGKVDKVKARRIIERIKHLSYEMKLIGVNRRN